MGRLAVGLGAFFVLFRLRFAHAPAGQGVGNLVARHCYVRAHMPYLYGPAASHNLYSSPRLA